MPVKVTLIPSGRSFEADPGEHVLDAARRQGIDLPHSCRRGNCLACRAHLVSGAVNYESGTDHALSESDRNNGYVLLCQATADTPLTLDVKEITAAGGAKIRRLPARVEKMVAITEDVMQLHLRVPLAANFTFAAGQYIDIILENGRRRSFSLAIPPSEPLLELHVRHRTGGEFTDQVFGKLRPKDVLRIEGPLGNFFLRDHGTGPMLFVAGGTGYAPLKAMLRSLIEKENVRPVHFYWGARAESDLYDRQWIEKESARHDWLHFTAVISEATGSWSGRTGLVNEAVLEDFPDLVQFDAYTSGPPAMVYAAQRAFPAHGLDSKRLFFDAFDYAPDTGSSEAN